MIPILESAILVAAAGCVYQIKKFSDMKKHDQHLYAFCQLRRDAITYIYENRESLSRTEYVAVKKVVDVLNTTIRTYKTHKVILFNFRKFKKYMEQTKSLSGKMEGIETSNPDIKKLQQRFVVLMFHGFFAYTPFLKSEVSARLLIAVLGAVAVLTGRRMSGYIASIKEAMNYSVKYHAADLAF